MCVYKAVCSVFLSNVVQGHQVPSCSLNSIIFPDSISTHEVTPASEPSWTTSIRLHFTRPGSNVLLTHGVTENTLALPAVMLSTLKDLLKVLSNSTQHMIKLETSYKKLVSASFIRAARCRILLTRSGVTIEDITRLTDRFWEFYLNGTLSDDNPA